jgi:hypothetical protein
MLRITRLLATSLLIAVATPQGRGQTPVARDSISLQQDLSEFEGVYRYRDGATLAMVANGGRLVAIIGEAKYLLRAVATDTFTNPSGHPIPFLRDTAGRVVACRGRRVRTGGRRAIAARRHLLWPTVFELARWGRGRCPAPSRSRP